MHRTGLDSDQPAEVPGAQQQIASVRYPDLPHGLERIDNVVANSFGSIEQLYTRCDTHLGLTTGFTAFDQLTSGLQKGRLSIIAALPGMGKATFAMNIAQNASLRQDARVAFFSGEIGKEDLVLRMLLSEAWVDKRRLETGYLLREDYDKLERTLLRLVGSGMFLDDTVGVSVSDIRARTLELNRVQGPAQLIVINGLDQITHNGGEDSREGNSVCNTLIPWVIQDLKNLAKELDASIVVLTDVSSTEERRPRLTDLPYASSITKQADLVVFVHRDAFFRREEEMNESERARAEIIVARNRTGPTGTVYLNFLPGFGRFENPEP